MILKAPFSQRRRSSVLLVSISLLALLTTSGAQFFSSKKVPELSCSLTPEQELERDPALQLMTYDVGDGEKSTWVYVEPDIKDMYRGELPSSTKVTPKFNGLAGKFINMSNKRVMLVWEESAGGKKHVMRHHNPFTASGTGTFPSHRFLFCSEDNEDDVLATFVIKDYPENIYYYDPYHVEGDPEQTEKNLKDLTPDERENYDGWRRTILFNEQYLNFTGRSYLANYLRSPPSHYMWRADYFGQEHWVTTRETHFVKLPETYELDPLNQHGKERKLKDDQPRLLQKYREPNQQVMNMTLKALSVAPRVFEIPNFLSDVEVNHITKLAAGITLKQSQTGDLNSGEKPVQDTTKTRTSYNSWVPREKSPIIDSIYRRAADLLRMDEALLRYRGVDEFKDLGTRMSIAEDLQLVHYAHRQEYTAHHDFGYSRIEGEKQGARFATLLFYLNEGMVGGETAFPRWVNGETFRQLKVKPEAGKAILFYSQLPDGNLDDFSQHAALPVTDGEKWLINLWVWEPHRID